MEALARFFGTYLHEDYDIDYSNSAEAAEDYGSSADLTAVCLALGEGLVLLEKYDAAGVEKWLLEHGCAYLPPDRTSTSDYLREVLQQIATAAARRETN